MDLARLFRRKSIERLINEMQGEQRLHRVLGPLSLTSLGVGAIIGAGIFAITGRVALAEAGPAVMISFIVAGIACALAALCYSEFAAMVPVAGSAYTYTYATLGELAAWIIGWDLVLEYGMSCSTVAAHWTNYFNEFLSVTLNWKIPAQFTSDPFTPVVVAGQEIQTWGNFPAMAILALVTYILVIGIRESAITNAILVIVKLTIVLFVIAMGVGYVQTKNYTEIPVENRLPSTVADYLNSHPEIKEKLPEGTVTPYTSGKDLVSKHEALLTGLSDVEKADLNKIESEAKKLGMIGILGVKDKMAALDNAVRSPFMPYGISGIMVGAALVFFSYIGFDSISTHSEEAINPQRDVPLGILASLCICTVLYILVAAVITGMEPYYKIDPGAAVAVAFRRQAELQNSTVLKWSTAFISAGALAGMTSVLLVTFLSQARVFLAMARDGLLPKSIFSVVHEKYRTPHRSTILTGGLMMLAAGFMPIRLLEEMVSIGTLMAFALVCGSVLMLRIRRPELHRPFRCPAVWIVAPAGVLVNVLMMLFLPLDTWIRLAVWLALGLVFYFAYGAKHSTLNHEKIAANSSQ